MIGVALKGIAGRKLRAALTMLAIVLGVAMVSGTLVLTDTMEKAVDTLFTDAYTGSDAVVSAKDIVDFAAGETSRPTVPAALLDKVKALPQVATASGAIVDVARLIDDSGKPISTHAGAAGFSIEADKPQFNPLELVEGRWPAGSQQIAIDPDTASNGFAVGDTIGVATRGPLRRFTISGIAEFTSVDAEGAITLAIFDPPTAQKLFGKTGRYDELLVSAKRGVSQEQLVQAIEPILPAAAEVTTGKAEVATQSKSSNEDIALIRKFMLAFGGLALFVGAFVIFNTLSTTVAQRTRELATLRTLGASRRQILGSVVLESLVFGALGSAVGLVLGPAVAKGLNALFVAAGQKVPQTGAVIETRTIVAALLVGVLITLLAGLFPAVRATSVPPISAVREGTLPRSGLAPYAPYVAGVGVLIVLGAGLLAYGMFANGLSVTQALILLAIGCLVLFIGVAAISSRLVKPLAWILTWPAARVAGAAGRLARNNSVRNPARTAVTASALMIGLALITFVAVLGKGLQDSMGEAVRSAVRAEYIVSGPITPDVGNALAAQATVSSVREDSANVFGSDVSVGGVNPQTITRMMSFDWDRGSFTELGSGGAVLQRKFADDHRLGVGSALSVQTPRGKRLELEVRGIYSPPTFDPILAPILISQESFDAAFERPQDMLVLVKGGSASPLEQAMKPFPEAELETKAQFAADRQKEIKDTLSLLYVLLALSIVVSLFGMVNTVALSVFERTRELGMLRAIGMTRRQARRMVRHESVITALIGATLGLPLGIFLAALVTRGLADEGVAFSLPLIPLVLFTLIALGAGLLAAAFPARRASRLNVLDALHYE
jgi:putative ABC transport system permease protein